MPVVSYRGVLLVILVSLFRGMSEGYTINTSYLPPHIMAPSTMRSPGFVISPGKYVFLTDIIRPLRILNKRFEHWPFRAN